LQQVGTDILYTILLIPFYALLLFGLLYVVNCAASTVSGLTKKNGEKRRTTSGVSKTMLEIQYGRRWRWAT
jgi:hypothetical protein